MSSSGSTFCVYPFSHLNVTMEGRATLCCRAGAHISSHGRPLSLHTDTFEQIWNSERMQTIRQEMLDGQRVADCEHCYRMEERGGTSLRQMALRESEKLLGAAPERAEPAARELVARRGLVAPAPTSLHLWLGNLCNLKCRMCNSSFSSQIAADPVHAGWTGAISREVVLLPDFVPGVDYAGFGELEPAAAGAGRTVRVAHDATIQLRGNGDPLVELEIAGKVEGAEAVQLTVLLDDRAIAEELLRGPEWSTVIRPDPPRETGIPLRLGFRLAGPGAARVAFHSLRIVCRGALSKAYPEQLVSRLPPGMPWAESPEVVLDELLASPERLRHLSFAGGEPMLNPQLPAILSRLVDTGHASHISLFFSSNATIFATQIVELLKQFQEVGLAFSLDGTGALQEYIRPPARWETLWKNVLRYHADMGAAVHTTPQAYNAFGLLDLVRLADRHRIAIGLNNVLYAPRWLSLDMLPQAIVDEVASEWMDYREQECREEHLGEVDTLLAYLKRDRPENQSELQDQFVRFTHDLDRSRGQSLAGANPRLFDRLREHGIEVSA